MATKPAALKVAPAPAADAAPAKPKGNSKLLIIIIVLLLAGGGGGGYFWWKQQQHAAKDTKGAEHTVEAKKAPPQFVPLDQFTVNLQDESSERYLQVAMVLEVSSAEAAEAVKAYMPIIRNRILMLLSSKRSADIANVEGKQKLAEAVVTEVRAPLSTPGPNKGIEGVHFSAFVIQ
jgi:flagellar FliL protein